MPYSKGLEVKVSPKVSYGLISIGGIILAAGQYAVALGNALSAGQINEGSIGLIATATVTFLGVAAGRYKQASDVIKGALPTHQVVSTDTASPLRESNVLYLDGHEVANALVKALNTEALLRQMTSKPKPAAAPVDSGNTPTPGEATS